ncbi:MAG: AAA family ATPase [Clostridia bacterium]
MLLNFSFKNFRSFYNKAELSMIATGKRDHLDNLINVKGIKHKILPTVLIYGGNAVGKTSVILAQMMLKEIVLKGNLINTVDSLLRNLPICSFIHEEEKYESPMEFNITFSDSLDEIKYDIINYKCVIKNRNNVEFINKPIVIEEELNINNINIFKRNKNDVIFNIKNEAFKYYYCSKENYINVQKLLNMQVKLFKENMGENTIFTTWYSNLNKKLVDRIVTWFNEKYILMYNFNESNAYYSVDLNNEKNVYEKIVLKGKEIDIIKSCIDIGPQTIIFESEKNNNILPDNNVKLELRSVYTIDSVNTNKTRISIPSDFTESKGTIKMYKFLKPLISTLASGATMVVDELDASIHPELLIGIIKIFNDTEINKKRAQLIFNTHNPIYLNKEIFRRDELYFIEKNEETYESELYSLVDFKEKNIRSDENYMKNYMNGKYGAIPYCNIENAIISILKDFEG